MPSRHLRRLGFSIGFLACAVGWVAAANSFNIAAPAFAQGGPIPATYAYQGKNISPELRIGNVPAHAKSLALIVDDPDAPAGLWTHWLAWNLPADTTSISESRLPPAAREGKNSNGHVRYDGPAPPKGTHRYFFRLYALDARLPLPTGSSRAALLDAMKSHIIGIAETFGVYSASQ